MSERPITETKAIATRTELGDFIAMFDEAEPWRRQNLGENHVTSAVSDLVQLQGGKLIISKHQHQRLSRSNVLQICITCFALYV